MKCTFFYIPTEILYNISQRLINNHHWTDWWSHRYNARTKSEGAVVQSPNQPKIFPKGYYTTHLIYINQKYLSNIRSRPTLSQRIISERGLLMNISNLYLLKVLYKKKTSLKMN